MNVMSKSVKNNGAIPDREKKKSNGRQAVTLRDVAREAGVAVSTVSTALNGGYGVADETRVAIVEVAKRMGFHPNAHARSLIKGRSTDTVGLFALHLDLGVVTKKFVLVQEILAEHGYVMPIYVAPTSCSKHHADQVKSLRNLLSQRPLGIVCNVQSLEPDTLSELEHYRLEGGFVVCYDLHTIIDCDHVHFDREESSRLAAEHLIALGHRRIAMYDNNDDWANSLYFPSFQRTLKRAGVAIRPDWLFTGELGDERTGIMIAEKFLALEERPTAICITDDAKSSAFVAHVQRNGVSVPQDLSVMSYDNMPVAECSPVPLTTVAQPMRATAEAVVSMLIDRVQGKYDGPSRRVVIRGHIVERESTAPPGRE